ncbi:diacylglyceryl transferase [Gramella sp. BOM4]|nr:diacylglyceryl transferase [Christiangramia bathymodioli]
MKKLKTRWGIDSNWQLIVILVVFAITGSSAAKLASPLCELLGITQENTHWSIYWSARIFLIFPIYQVLLVSFGWIFGQFEFFWSFEKKMLSRFGFAKLFRN